MKIGILECDKVLDKFQKEHGSYPDMFNHLLRGIDPDIELISYDVIHGQLPRDIDECDGYITTGSKYGANDGFDWISGLENFLRALNRRQKKFVGICFGHQVLVKALGGSIHRSPKGWGAGVTFNKVVREAQWMEPQSAGVDLIVSHQDQVETLPEGFEVLVSSQFCPHYMVRYGDHFLSIQGHPEFSKAYSKDLMNDRRDRIPDNRIREGMTSLNAEVDDRLVAQWIINFFHYDPGHQC